MTRPLRYLFPRYILATACVLSAQCALPAFAQDNAPQPKLSLEHKMLLRCSTAFALTSKAQDEGDAAALQHPILATRGREFFIHSMVQVMDGAGLNRAQVVAQVVQERSELQDENTLEQVMPVCLQLLENSGL